MKRDNILSLNTNDEEKVRLLKKILQTKSFLIVYENDEEDATSFLFTEGMTLGELTFYEKAISNYVTNEIYKDK